jgi:hypothetical protein
MSDSARYNSIVSKLRIDDSDLTRVEMRLTRLTRLGRDASLDIGRTLIRGLRSPQLRAAFDDVEKRIKRLGTVSASAGSTSLARPGGSFLDRTLWSIKQMEDRQRVREQATESARLRVSSGRADDNLSRLRGLATPGDGAGGGLGGLGMMVSQAGGMALYNSLVGAMRMTTDALMATASTFHRVNREAESAVVGLQGVYMSGMGMGADEARGTARRTFGRLERAAATGPAEAIDYISAYQRLFTTLRQAGASSSEIEKLTVQSVGAGEMDMPGRGRFLGPMDIYQSMTSGLRPDITPYTVRALGNIGVSPEQFRASDQREKIDTLLRAYDTYEGSIIEFGKTVAAQEDTLADNLKRFARAISPEPYEGYRSGLMSANAIMDDLNEENSHFRDGLRLTTKALSGMAEDVGRGFHDELLRVLPSLGSTISQVGTELVRFREETRALSELFGSISAGMLVIGSELALWGSRFANRVLTAPGNNFAIAGAQAAYDWATMARLPGLNEEGIPLSLLAPGGAGSEDGIPDLLRKPESLGGAIGAAAGRELTKHPRKVEVDVNVEWGNSRSLALAMQQAITVALDAEARAPRSSFAASTFRSY